MQATVHGRNTDGSYHVTIQGRPSVNLSEADAAALSGMRPDELHTKSQANAEALPPEPGMPEKATTQDHEPAGSEGELDETNAVKGAGRYDQVPLMARWKDNPDGAVRTWDEAKQIFRKHIKKVEPMMEEALDLVDVIEVRFKTPEEMKGKWASYAPARGKKHYQWRDFFDNGRIVLHVDQRVVKSDQAILGIIAHELYELNAIRNKIGSGSIPAVALQRFIDDVHSAAVELQNKSVHHKQNQNDKTN
ncbi:hypothetical protein [Prosthecobacter fusiformis]|uniref:hypothetical protein n=1 Tax=Prosthecobacter fusiformis TaxID=48464 RepID=UPI001060141F|nr:hypothetical protein [Prosthecobacter fusiformis]